MNPEVGMTGETPGVAEGRTEAERRAFREAQQLLVAFGVGAMPATLGLCLMGGDALEGDFGLGGTVGMLSAGGMSPACLAIGARARRLWAGGATLGRVHSAICRPLLAMLFAILVGMFLFAVEFSILAGER